MQKLINLCHAIVFGIGAVALAVLIIVAFLQVCFRYLLNNALPWPEEICRFAFILMSYVGMVMMMRKDGHLRVDVALTFASPFLNKILQVLCWGGTAFYCGVAAWLTWEMLIAVKDMEQMASTIEIPVYLTWIPIPVGFGLCGLLALLRLAAVFAPQKPVAIKG